MSQSVSKEHRIPGGSPQDRVDGLLDRIIRQIDEALAKKPPGRGLEEAFEEDEEELTQIEKIDPQLPPGSKS